MPTADAVGAPDYCQLDPDCPPQVHLSDPEILEVALVPLHDYPTMPGRRLEDTT